MDNILEQVDNIVNYISNTSDYKNYLILKEKLEKDETILNLIKEIKQLQKKAVNDEYNGKDIKNIDIEIKEKSDILNSKYLYQEYIELHSRIDEQLQEIKFILNNYFNNKIN